MIDVSEFMKLGDIHVKYSTSPSLLYGKSVICAHDADVATRVVFPFMRQRQEQFVLVTVHDIPVDDQRVSLAPDNMDKWFGNNATAGSDKVQGIPIGLPPTYARVHAVDGMGGEEKRRLLLQLMEDGHEERNLVYMAHRNETNPQLRTQLYDMFGTKDWATCKGGDKRIPYADYIQDVHSHRFMICPPGAGLDCHRVWESLYLGTVPIVQRSPAMEYFEELPIVFVDDFEEVTPEFLKSAPMGDQMRMLDMEYWADRIRGSVDA
tara:strand:- start:1838 stop:2629 length:792 start_codon:yes stop_codon:yes gene_type:complete